MTAPPAAMVDIASMMSVLADRYGDRPAIDDESIAYTYRGLHATTTSLAAGLRELGAGPGDAAVWLSPNSADYLVAYLATGKAGLRFSPLNYYLRAGELDAAIETVAPRLMFAAAEYIEVLEPLCERHGIEHRFVVDRDDPVGSWRPWRELMIEVDPETSCGGHADAPHEIIFTSGTTGQVKAVGRSQGKRLGESLVVVQQIPHEGGDVHTLRGSPQFHVGGATSPVQAFLQGSRVSIYTYKPHRLVDRLKQGQINYVTGVPAQYAMLFDSGLLEGVDVSGVRYCSVGGNGAAPEQFLQIQRAFPHAELVHFYGSTESGLVTSIRGQEFLDRLTSIGRPAPGVELRIVDDEGVDVPRGEVGEIWVKSPYVMAGYHRRPDLDELAFSPDGYLRMGDLARQDDEGYVFIVGRKKDMIITGGENVFPKEVEDVITDLDFVAEVAVVGAPDPTYEERVVAVVRLEARAAGGESEMAEAVQATVRTRLAGYKAPKNVFFVEDFPRNALGKIDKVALRSVYRRAAEA